jgi:protein O-GlcNAc transferase
MSDKNVPNEVNPMPDFEYVLHMIYLVLGKWFHSLLRWYESFFTLDQKDQFLVYANLVSHYRGKGKMDKAVHMATKAVKIAPAGKKEGAQKSLAELYFLIGDVANAKKNFEAVLKAGDDAEVKTKLASIYSEEGNLESAIKLYTEALEKNKKDHESMFLLAQLYDKAEKSDDVITILQSAIELSPESISYHQYLGFTYESLDRHKDAVPHFKKVMELEQALANQ